MQLSRAATAAAVAPAEPSAPLSPAPAPAPAPPGPLPHSAADGAPAGGQGGPGRREEPQCAQLAAASGPSPGAGMDGPGASAVVVRVGIPDLQQTKCLRLDPAAPVWAAKQRVLCALNHSLQDALNYGLFQPPSRGRAGKFLDEERLLQEYPPNLDTPLPYLEVSGGRGRRSARGTPRRARGPERWRARQRGARRVGAGELVCERGGGCRAPGAVCRVRGVSRVRCARPAARAVGCEQA